MRPRTVISGRPNWTNSTGRSIFSMLRRKTMTRSPYGSSKRTGPRSTFICRIVGAVQSDRQLFPVAKLNAATIAGHARQSGRNLGKHAGGDQARSGRHPVHAAADGRRSGRPRRARRVRLVVANAADAEKFARSAAKFLKISVGEARRATGFPIKTLSREPRICAEGVTRADDPLLLYFTSGTTSKPKLVLHSHRSYPVGHLSTMYWIGLRPGDVHSISARRAGRNTPGARFSRPGTRARPFSFIITSASTRERFSSRSRRCRVTRLCAPPTVWRMLIQENLADYPNSLREIVERRRTAQPGDHRTRARGLEHHDPRRLRADRDDGADRQFARTKNQIRRDGQSAARLWVGPARR